MIDEILDFFSDIYGWCEDTAGAAIDWIMDIPIFDFAGIEIGGDFSMFGLAFGILSSGTVFVLRDYMMKPFTQHMTPFGAIFWEGATYVACLIVGYQVGKRMGDD